MSAKDDGEFKDFGDVCLFAEHTDRDGNRFDRASMERITKRCNERISRRKAFAPIVIRHNGPGLDPEVIGFCGPYRLGEIESADGSGMVAAVYGRMRVYRDDAHKVRKYPFRSVEFWCSKSKPTDGFFHPVSLLGSETPELDLPVMYGKSDTAGLRCVKYSRAAHYAAEAVAAGGMNTSIPSTNLKEKKNYEKGNCMLSPEDIAQIVEAMKPVIQAQIAELNPAPQVSEEMPDMPTDQDPAADGLATDEPPMDAEGAEGDMPPGLDVDGDGDADGPPGDAEAPPELARRAPVRPRRRSSATGRSWAPRRLSARRACRP